MASMNKWIGIGRLTRDVELRYTAEGKAVASFTLAVDRGYGSDNTDFVNVSAWEKQAENCAEYIGKGRLVAVEGRLQIRSYEDKEGNKRIAPEIVASNVVFLDGKKE